MPTVIRFSRRRYLASVTDVTELFDQIPEPIAYFDSDNRLSACNLSFRDNFPVVIESDFLRRVSNGPVSGHSQIGHDALPVRLPLPGPTTANLPADARQS